MSRLMLCRPANVRAWSERAGRVFGVADPNGHGWMCRAACRGANPDVFFPSVGRHDTMAEARACCAGCPVRVECLCWGLGEHVGVYGGTSDLERRRVRAEVRRVLAARAEPLAVAG